MVELEQEAHKERIAELQTRLEEVQTQLNDLHCTDINALKRAYKTLQQHVQALDIESMHLTNVVSKIDPPILTPEVLAREIGVLAAIAAGAWGLLKGLACIRLPPSKRTTHTVVVGALALAGGRMMQSGVSLLRRALLDGRDAKEQLQTDWRTVADRINIMVQLCQPVASNKPASNCVEQSSAAVSNRHSIDQPPAPSTSHRRSVEQPSVAAPLPASSHRQGGEKPSVYPALPAPAPALSSA